ncbi:MAG TPA: glycosyl hydrolase, partial [Tepidisphaeraceae bacterium]
MRQILAAMALLAWPTFLLAQNTIHLEAEDAQLVGVMRATTRPSFSGSGYVSGFDQEQDKVVFKIPLREGGVYDVKIRYASTSVKGYYLNVNGIDHKGIFPSSENKFAEFNAGKAELGAGDNTIAIEKYWGFYDIDCIDLIPSPPSKIIAKPPSGLSDREASTATQALFAKLRDHYGDGTFSGVYSDEDAEYAHQTTGKFPAIMGGDLIDYTPSRVERGTISNEVPRLIAASRGGYIVTLSWHWNAPTGLIDKMLPGDNGQQIDARWYKGFYTNATTFDFQKALANPRSAEYALLLRDIDAIAVQLKKLSDANVPVLWRPLHEAEGGWFWWGAKGPQSFVKLWRLLHDR